MMPANNFATHPKTVPGINAGNNHAAHFVRHVTAMPAAILRDTRALQSITGVDYALLDQHGLDEPEILELIVMAGLAVYANIMADATAMDADDMFEEF